MNILTYYKLMFSLAQYHKYSIEDLNNLYPFERDLYVDLLEEHLAKQEEERQKAKQKG